MQPRLAWNSKSCLSLLGAGRCGLHPSRLSLRVLVLTFQAYKRQTRQEALSITELGPQQVRVPAAHTSSHPHPSGDATAGCRALTLPLLAQLPVVLAELQDELRAEQLDLRVWGQDLGRSPVLDDSIGLDVQVPVHPRAQTGVVRMACPPLPHHTVLGRLPISSGYS